MAFRILQFLYQNHSFILISHIQCYMHVSYQLQDLVTNT